MSALVDERTVEVPDGPDAHATKIEPKPFGPGSLLWDMSGDRLATATSGCAFVLQVMHPAIGTVVDKRSTFRTDPWGRAARSFDSVQTWVYGGEEALEEGRRLRRMHKTINAPGPDGQTYQALSPEPWAWVPLTGFWAFHISSQYFFPEPWPEEQVRRLYDETLNLCRILQVPERMLPPTPEDYWVYFDHMVDNVLVDHPVAHEVINSAAHSPAPPTMAPLMRPAWPAMRRLLSTFNRTFTVGLLPPAARDKLKLRWTKSDELQLRVLARTVGALNERLPEKQRYLPIAYRAREAARQQAALTDALATRAM